MIQMADIPVSWHPRQTLDRDGVELRIGRGAKVWVSYVELMQNDPSQLIAIVESKLSMAQKTAALGARI